MKTKINLLDINNTNTVNNRYEFKVHRKKAITNIHIKPTLCIDPNIIKIVFKGFLYKADLIYFEKCIKEEEKFSIHIFLENGHSKRLSKTLVINYRNKKNNKNNNENNTENRDYKIQKKLPWISNISPKIERGFMKIRKDIVFTSWKRLQLFCGKKTSPNYYQIVYQLDCSCNGKYNGKSKKRVFTRCIEHQEDSMSGKWE